MSTEKIEAARTQATNNRISEARENFANYTQRVAFNITLSRDMIGMLHVVRDWGCQKQPDEVWAPVVHNWKSIYPRSDSHFVPQVQSLIRRGLVYHDYIEQKDAPMGHRYYKLTRAGELMCEMLVEVGLLPAISSERKTA